MPRMGKAAKARRKQAGRALKRSAKRLHKAREGGRAVVLDRRPMGVRASWGRHVEIAEREYSINREKYRKAGGPNRAKSAGAKQARRKAGRGTHVTTRDTSAFVTATRTWGI